MLFKTHTYECTNKLAFMHPLQAPKHTRTYVYCTPLTHKRPRERDRDRERQADRERQRQDDRERQREREREREADWSRDIDP